MTNKTQVRGDLTVADYLDAMGSASRRSDCDTLVQLMTKVTGKEPRMYGTGIVGFDTYRYKYESGREGEAPVVAFASRKGCLYLANLTGVNLAVLEKLVVRGRDYIKKTYPTGRSL